MRALVALVLLWCGVASAQVGYTEPAGSVSTYCTNGAGNTGPITCGSTSQIASAVVAYQEATFGSPGGYRVPGSNATQAWVQFCYDSGGCGSVSYIQIVLTTVPECRATGSSGSTGLVLQGGGPPHLCGCGTNQIFDPVLDRCGKSCTAGGTASEGYYRLGTSSSTRPLLLACNAGCETVFDGQSPGGSATENGVKIWYAKGAYIYTGAACAPSVEQGASAPDSTEAPPPNTCPSTHQGGTVNGQWVCIARSDGTASPPLPGASAPGSDSKTDITVINNGDGTTTTTTKTSGTKWNGSTGGTTEWSKESIVTCDTAGNCTEETRTAGGAPGDGEGEEEEKEEDCPEGSTQARCLGLGTVPDDGPLTVVSKALAITPDSGWEQAKTCPADRVLNLAAVTVTFPFKLLCDAADMARPVVLGVAYVTALLGFLGLSRRE